MNPRQGFAEENLVLIHRDYYRTNETSNEKRRPILLLAWYTEFADILLGNSSFRLTNEDYQHLQQKGATDIVFGMIGLFTTSHSVFAHRNLSDNQARQNCKNFVSALLLLKKKRNDGVHYKIENSNFLKETLQQMIDICQLLEDFGMSNDQSNMFAEDCNRQLQNLNNPDYNHLY
jgi:hypothetical protein